MSEFRKNPWTAANFLKETVPEKDLIASVLFFQLIVGVSNSRTFQLDPGGSHRSDSIVGDGWVECSVNVGVHCVA